MKLHKPSHTAQKPNKDVLSRGLGTEIQRKENRTGMPDHLKSGIENLSGMDMGDVKVHYNSAKPAGLQAHAYAQGSDIHIAPGQERHLPHEAWHVVQQKQGRVKPTMQMKGKVDVNDDHGLEKEADVMGSKAARPYIDIQNKSLNKNIAYGSTVQAYAIARDPKMGSLYSVSDDKGMVTGMNTPNHDLYVDNISKIGEINVAAQKSMLSFEGGGSAPLFGKRYTKVAAKFKRINIHEKAPKFYNKDNVDVHHVDTTASYYKWVEAALREQSIAKYQKVIDLVKQEPWAKYYTDLHQLLGPLVKGLELFKKLVIANQTTASYHDVVNEMDAPQGLVSVLESVLYSKTATKETFSEALENIKHYIHVIKIGLGEDSSLMDTLDEVDQRFSSFSKLFPEGHTVNMIYLHSTNYQLGMLDSIDHHDPMFYRACDVMASTVMGNTVDGGNKDQLKIYSASEGGAFHYAAKILKSGNDWVSLESFAASERERDILGITSENAGTNLDNSWQYMMYGSVKKRGGTLSEEDNYFELYTKLRYYLKGLQGGGSFRTDQRDRLTGQIDKDALLVEFAGNGVEAERVWERLKLNGVFDENGEVASPHYLEESYISIRLEKKDRPKAAAISTKLKMLYASPRSTRRHVQATGNDEIKNIVAWAKLLKLPINTGDLATAVDKEIFTDEGGPTRAHNMGWGEMISAMVKANKTVKF